MASWIDDEGNELQLPERVTPEQVLQMANVVGGTPGQVGDALAGLGVAIERPVAQVLDWDSPAAQAVMEQARAADADPMVVVNGILAEFPKHVRWNLGMREIVRVDRDTLRAKVGSGNPRRHLEVEYEPGVDLYTVRIVRTVTRGRRRGGRVVEQEQGRVYGEDLGETAITLHGKAWEGSSR